MKFLSTALAAVVALSSTATTIATSSISASTKEVLTTSKTSLHQGGASIQRHLVAQQIRGGQTRRHLEDGQGQADEEQQAEEEGEGDGEENNGDEEQQDEDQDQQQDENQDQDDAEAQEEEQADDADNADDADADAAAEEDEDVTSSEYIQATSCTSFTVEPEDNGMEDIWDWAGLETYRVAEKSYVFYKYDYDGDGTFDGNYMIDMETWMEEMAYAAGGYDAGCRELEDAYDLFGDDDSDLQALAGIDLEQYMEASGNNVEYESMDTIYVGTVCGMVNNGWFSGNNENMILDGIFLDDSCTTFVPSLTYKYRELLANGAATEYDLPTAVSIVSQYPLSCANLGICEDLLGYSVNADQCTTFEEDWQTAEEDAEAAAQEEEEADQAQDDADAQDDDQQAEDENANNDDDQEGGRKLEDAEQQGDAEEEEAAADEGDDAAAADDAVDEEEEEAVDEEEEEAVEESSSYAISQEDLGEGIATACYSIQAALEQGLTLETYLKENGQLPPSNGLSKNAKIGLIIGAILLALIICVFSIKIKKAPRKKANNSDGKEEPLVGEGSDDTDSEKSAYEERA